MTERNTLADVCAHLADQFPGRWVGDELPKAEQLEAHLPAILVEDVPGSTENETWQQGHGPLNNIVSIDIEILDHAADPYALRQLAAAVSAAMYSLVLVRAARVSWVTCPSLFHKRPDWNPRVKRVGAEFDLSVRRF